MKGARKVLIVTLMLQNWLRIGFGMILEMGFPEILSHDHIFFSRHTVHRFVIALVMGILQNVLAAGSCLIPHQVSVQHSQTP